MEFLFVLLPTRKVGVWQRVLSYVLGSVASYSEARDAESEVWVGFQSHDLYFDAGQPLPCVSFLISQMDNPLVMQWVQRGRNNLTTTLLALDAPPMPTGFGEISGRSAQANTCL